MGFGEALSKIFKKEGETKASDKIGQDSKVENQTTEGLASHDQDPASGKGINSSVQLTESTQKEEINLEEVETKEEVKTQESTSSNEQVTKEKILEVLSDVYDPEIPIDIVNLGLIYEVEIIEGGNVHVKMTMTAPGCPSSAQIAAESQMLIEGLRGVKEAIIDIVWDPPWDPSRMSEDAKRGLGYL
ncbi:MAG TPA: metal-sulfur cluster assembly factor [Thermodesulfobacteriota bacterium]|jgi:metal-sulfur cluster biosynthetic enzyme